MTRCRTIENATPRASEPRARVKEQTNKLPPTEGLSCGSCTYTEVGHVGTGRPLMVQLGQGVSGDVIVSKGVG